MRFEVRSQLQEFFLHLLFLLLLLLPFLLLLATQLCSLLLSGPYLRRINCFNSRNDSMGSVFNPWPTTRLESIAWRLCRRQLFTCSSLEATRGETSKSNELTLPHSSSRTRSLYAHIHIEWSPSSIAILLRAGQLAAAFLSIVLNDSIRCDAMRCDSNRLVYIRFDSHAIIKHTLPHVSLSLIFAHPTCYVFGCQRQAMRRLVDDAAK